MKNKYIIKSNKKKINQIKNIEEAISILKKNSKKNFIESCDVVVMLGINTKKTDENVRGFTVLPNGIGKKITVLVFAHGEKAEEAKKAEADFIGMEDLVKKIKRKKIKFDVAVATPESMKTISVLGSILGPKGLMPNYKMGTVTSKIFETVKKIKNGQIRYKNDKNGIIHTSIGKINFSKKEIKENLISFINTLKKQKPNHIKGIYFKKLFLTTTMGKSIEINQSEIE
ncbi:MAG: 50S ribosomal protein L1 [Buchnera aphidicola (Periphyllus lyropictus)]|uniref:50S ribosomal protein L1 n=1 Tax=Buchnera aphidicola TaxID=9 RepID=UPI001EC69DA4|nr:50S ribosomal protein L1 [Buchnera aphidicola]NIH16772.1 50S ribosomal protein L1 [Buchnera aphidicola (Periphyllus lyropictus)]USS94671.1 50S ribosomal protein L1 [Buchnera aphidicola (Periphyllus lyropictus)]